MKKIEDLPEEIQKKIIQEEASSVTQREILDRLYAEGYTEVTEDNLRGYIKRNRRRITQEASKDNSFNSRTIDYYWDTISQTRNMNTEMYGLFLELRKSPEKKSKNVECPHCHKTVKISVEDYNAIIKTSTAILEQIKHVDKILGRLQNKQSMQLNVNIVDLSKKLQIALPELMENLQRQNIIKILNKKRFRERFQS